MKMNFFNYLVITLIRGWKTFVLTTLTVMLAMINMTVDNTLFNIVNWAVIIFNILALTHDRATCVAFNEKEEIKELAKMWEEKEKERK